MDIIGPLIIAALTYKVKLIDDRKSENFEKFKNYLKREGISRAIPKNGVPEYDAWLEKDIQFFLLDCYVTFSNDEGKKLALLDYYKDSHDNETARIQTFVLILINLACLFVFNYSNGYPEFWKFCIEFVLIASSLGVFSKQADRSIINNSFINVSNSQTSKITYLETQIKIEKEIAAINKKFQKF